MFGFACGASEVDDDEVACRLPVYYININESPSATTAQAPRGRLLTMTCGVGTLFGAVKDKLAPHVMVINITASRLFAGSGWNQGMATWTQIYRGSGSGTGGYARAAAGPARHRQFAEPGSSAAALDGEARAARVRIGQDTSRARSQRHARRAGWRWLVCLLG